MIGLYDSGAGGLTIFTELVEISAATGLCYYADTKNLPLGEKTNEEIDAATEQGVTYLFEKGCNLVVLACNTATVTSIRKLQNGWLKKYPGKNVLGIVRPVSEALHEYEIMQDATIAILATKATIASKFYEEELRDAGYNSIVDIEASGLAIAIEEGDETKQRELLAQYFNSIDVASIDALVLACTHYPIIKDIIKQEFVKAGGKETVNVISQSDIVPEKLIDYILRHEELDLLTGQGIEIFVNGDAEEFEKKLENFFDIKAKAVQV